MEIENLNKVIAKMGLFILTLSIAGKAAGYLFNVLLIKSITVEAYGIFSLAWGVVAFSMAFLLLGIPEAVSRFVAFYRGEENKDKVNSTIRTGGILNICLICISLIILSLLYLFFPEFLSLKGSEFLLVCVLFCLRSTEIFFNSVIYGFRKPHITQAIRFILEILKPISLFVVILFGISLFGAIFALVVAVAIPTLISAIYAIRKFGLGRNFDLNLAKKLFKFGIPMTATSTANNFLGWADMFMIRMFVGFSALGVYYIANLTAAVMLVFFSAFISIYNPIITELFGKKDTKQISHLTTHLLKLLFLICMPILIIFVVFAKDILTILFTEEYAAGALAFQIMAFSMFFYGISNLFTTILNSSGNPRKVSIIVIVASFVNVCANYVLIPLYGIEGAAIATVFSSLLMLILSYFEVKKLNI